MGQVVGTIHLSQRDGSAMYYVNSLKDLTNVIIPHFEKYPLLTQKRADFLLFKSVVELMNDKEHLKIDGLDKIVSIRASMNKGLPAVLTEAFPNAIPVSRPLVEVPENIDPYWLAGFSEGESCFNVSISKSKTCKIGFRVQLRFIIGQHSRDSLLFESILKNWQCGKIGVESQNLVVRFNVLKFTELNDIIIPFRL